MIIYAKQMQAASVKGWKDISSVFSDTSKSPDSDTVLSPSDDQRPAGVTGYGSRFVAYLL